MYIMYRLTIYSDKILRYMVVFIYLYIKGNINHINLHQNVKKKQKNLQTETKLTKMLPNEARISEVIKNILNKSKITSAPPFSL